MQIVLLYTVLSMARAFPTPTPAPLSLTFSNRQERLEVDLFAPSGGERPVALKAISHFVRCWRTNKERPVDARTLQILSQMSRHFNNAEIVVVSGVRAAPYGAPNSRHFVGRAMDIRVPGVPARQVRDYVWRNFRGVGVGYYPEQQFVHIDTRDQDTGWIDHAQHGESSKGVRYFIRPDNDPTPPPEAAQSLALVLSLIAG
jgi:uncharacterized protein YcbK (DUF882 family)